MDMITECQTALAFPRYVSDAELGVVGPVPDSALDLLDLFGSVLFSCRTILYLITYDDREGESFSYVLRIVTSPPPFLIKTLPPDQTHLRMLTMLQNLEEEVEEARRSIINFTIYLIFVQSIYGMRATVSLRFPLPFFFFFSPPSFFFFFFFFCLSFFDSDSHILSPGPSLLPNSHVTDSEDGSRYLHRQR